MEEKRPTYTPTTKVTAGVLAGAVTGLTVFILGEFGIQLTPEAAISASVVFTFIIQWLVPEDLFRR